MYAIEVKQALAAAEEKLPALIAALPPEPNGEGLRIREYVKKDTNFHKQHGPINIVVVGDSVSHGCVGGLFGNSYDTVYHNRLRLMINRTFPGIPVNIINTAVGGECASYADENFERDVLSHHPDLVIACFGLNDVNKEEEVFCRSLGSLFDQCKKNDLDVIYLSPNMLNTYRSPLTADIYFAYAQKTADMQNEGRMDRFMELARREAQERGIPVADCYAVWRALQENGVDTTLLLANYINHPLREMHALFAEVLFLTIFSVPYGGERGTETDGMTAEAKK
ncbi:MAG: GDSL family lipase [Clostridia bacterium]|nr:GDSL family lipase [Clostridia bacterium]